MDQLTELYQYTQNLPNGSVVGLSLGLKVQNETRSLYNKGISKPMWSPGIVLFIIPYFKGSEDIDNTVLLPGYNYPLSLNKKQWQSTTFYHSSGECHYKRWVFFFSLLLFVKRIFLLFGESGRSNKVMLAINKWEKMFYGRELKTII